MKEAKRKLRRKKIERLFNIRRNNISKSQRFAFDIDNNL